MESKWADKKERKSQCKITIKKWIAIRLQSLLVLYDAKRIFNNNAHVQPKIWFLLLHNICVNVIFFRRNRDMYVLFLHKRKFYKKNALESSKIDFSFESAKLLINRNQTKVETIWKFSSGLLHFRRLDHLLFSE